MEKESLSLFGALKFSKQFFSKLYFEFVLFYLGRLMCMLEETLVPILVAIMINQMVYYRNIDVFIKVGITFFAVSLFSCLIYYLAYEIYIDFWGKIADRVRKKMYQNELHMNAEEMANANYGDLSQLIQWKSIECGELVVKSILNNFNVMLNIIICLIVVYKINILIGVIFTLMVPVSVYVSMKYGARIRRERKKNESSYGRYLSWLYEVFGLFKDIRLMCAEHYTMKKFCEYQDDLIKTDVKAGIASLTAQGIIDNVNVWVRMVLYGILVIIAAKSGITIGTVTIILAYFTTTTQKLNLVCENYMFAQWRLATIGRLKEMLEIPLAKEDEEAKPIKIQKGSVEFSNVSFAYKGKSDIIDGLNLKIRAGEKVAIVGESGCGKSTLTYMLLGFYPAMKGTVSIDGTDISHSTLKSLRDGIGVVQQEVLIFKGTVRENVLAGKPDATEQEMVNACKAAGAYEFVMKMEDGFDTLLGKEARKLSGGQKQRIAIARAYLKNPSLLIFDEATASLDKETEAQIHENWKHVLEGRTAIVIAHRQSAVMLCDRVALMEHGKIVEEGTPEEMLAHSKRFQALFAVKEEVAEC